MRPLTVIFIDHSRLPAVFEAAQAEFPSAGEMLVLHRGARASNCPASYVPLNERKLDERSRYKLILDQSEGLETRVLEEQIREALRVSVFEARNSKIELEVLVFKNGSFETQVLIDSRLAD